MNSNKSNILLGLFFIFLGIGFAGNAFHLWNFSLFFPGWWTLFIIVPCLITITQNGPQTGSVVGLIIGIMLLLSRQGIVSGDILGKLLIPAILVVIGISIVFNNFSRSRIPQSDGSSDYISGPLNRENGNLNYYTATFASRNESFDNQIFEGANVNAIFGSACLHLENAIINEDIVINCNSTFGGIEIFLPGYVNVKVSSTPIFGGVTNRRRGMTNTDAPTVYINATSMFGGVEIR